MMTNFPSPKMSGAFNLILPTVLFNLGETVQVLFVYAIIQPLLMFLHQFPLYSE